MNSAVALVEAYLHANGYFTVTEYPIIEAMEGETFRVRTDIDIMAMRLPGARRLIPGRRSRGRTKRTVFEPDPTLRPTDDRVDLLIGEVKECHAEDGPRVRLVAVGSHGAPRKSYDVITLGHILEFFHETIRQHWDIMQHAHFTHPGLGFLMMQEKARRRTGKNRSGTG